MAISKTKKKDSTYFLVTYRDSRDGQVHTLKAETIRDSTLGLSFIAISDFIFDTSAVIANPVEEQQRVRFENVKCLHLSIYSVLSIEEVGRSHKGLTFKKDKSKVVAFPGTGTPPSPN